MKLEEDDSPEGFDKPKHVYTAVFRMTEKPWLAGIIVFDTGEVKMNRARVEPGRTLVIELEGKAANALQVEMCRHIWKAISQAFPFDLAVFAEGVVQNSGYILTGGQ